MEERSAVILLSNPSLEPPSACRRPRLFLFATSNANSEIEKW